MLLLSFTIMQDRIIRPQDESSTFIEPPQDDGELYSHLRQAHYNQLERKELSTTHLQDAGYDSCFVRDDHAFNNEFTMLTQLTMMFL